MVYGQTEQEWMLVWWWRQLHHIWKVNVHTEAFRFVNILVTVQRIAGKELVSTYGNHIGIGMSARVDQALRGRVSPKKQVISLRTLKSWIKALKQAWEQAADRGIGLEAAVGE